jgi:hypothetical protein
MALEKGIGARALELEGYTSYRCLMSFLVDGCIVCVLLIYSEV